MICGLTIGLLALVSVAGGYVENRTRTISQFVGRLTCRSNHARGSSDGQ